MDAGTGMIMLSRGRAPLAVAMTASALPRKVLTWCTTAAKRKNSDGGSGPTSRGAESQAAQARIFDGLGSVIRRFITRLDLTTTTNNQSHFVKFRQLPAGFRQLPERGLISGLWGVISEPCILSKFELEVCKFH